ncbi:MAG: AAA family ATPase [Bacteroidia bacterium]
MINIGYGVADYKMMVKYGMYYVDRTQFLHVLETSNAPYTIFLRPRRFGKSLWISVLQYYYGIQFKSEFEALFGNRHVGKKPTALANSYFILRMNFSGISTDSEKELKEDFVKVVRSSIENFLTDYATYFDKEVRETIVSENTAHSLMKIFFQEIKHLPYKVYLLIDEYDHFANELISFKKEVFIKAVTKNGWVRKFYETLKNAANEGIVEKMFITGVSPITLDSLTSGFNIGSHQSQDFALHNLMGFTEEEVMDILKGIDAPTEQLSYLMLILKEWYNGYLFNPDVTNRLYNSDMVLYFAKEYVSSKKIPRRLLDVNIASDYGKIRSIFRVGEMEESRWHYVEELLQNGVVSNKMTEMFSFERGFTSRDFLSLLCYMGYLTIQAAAPLGKLSLSIPNRVISELYRDYFIRILDERSGMNTDVNLLEDALVTLLIENEPRPLLEMLCEVLRQLTLRDYQNMDEKHIQAMFFSYLSLASDYDVNSEYQKKFFDILLTRNALANATLTNEFLFEFKYAKKATDYRLGKIDQAAIEQVTGYLNHKKITRHPNLHAWRIVIVGDTLEICEEVPRG